MFADFKETQLQWAYMDGKIIGNLWAKNKN
jgi:hypothetical protein